MVWILWTPPQKQTHPASTPPQGTHHAQPHPQNRPLELQRQHQPRLYQPPNSNTPPNRTSPNNLPTLHHPKTMRTTSTHKRHHPRRKQHQPRNRSHTSRHPLQRTSQRRTTRQNSPNHPTHIPQPHTTKETPHPLQKLPQTYAQVDTQQTRHTPRIRHAPRTRLLQPMQTRLQRPRSNQHPPRPTQNPRRHQIQPTKQKTHRTKKPLTYSTNTPKRSTPQ